MFEGKPPRTADALPLEEPQHGDSLRPLSWGDLVARLSAAREVRASYRGAGAAADASCAPSALAATGGFAFAPPSGGRDRLIRP